MQVNGLEGKMPSYPPEEESMFNVRVPWNRTEQRPAVPRSPRWPARAPAAILACVVLLLGALFTNVPLAQADSRIINISASVSGCGSNGGACDNAADHLPPGAQFRLISPVNMTLEAGTYRISHAGSKGRYQGWRINGSDQRVWNFGIAIKAGGGKGTLLYVVVADGIYRSVADLAASNGAVRAGRGGPNSRLPVITRTGGPKSYADTLTLKSRTKLSFFVLDYDVSDNAGGVSLRIDPMTRK